ncbi:hypothetical protein EVAR_20387_1 [Eumeta japonica]|uniref:Uncharacterized protein n=1 Tax=Eumeta variegata TaxID=151549 RepID=A0A4C1TXV9_EUMVA|nr:hypothetical protein EVAR_20387_1 [Eumeta japonica]
MQTILEPEEFRSRLGSELKVGPELKSKAGTRWDYGNASKAPQLFFRYDYQFISELEAYFKYVDTAMPWSDALSECERDGAQLFYPPSEEEWKIVKAELNSLRNKTLVIYLGMYNVTDMGELVTIAVRRRMRTLPVVAVDTARYAADTAV